MPELPDVEYGIADLRSKAAAETIAELTSVCEARFQVDLIDHGKRAGRLPGDHEPRWSERANTPEWVTDRLGPLRDEGLLARLPFGSELTDIEIGLVASGRGGATPAMSPPGHPDSGQ